MPWTSAPRIVAAAAVVHGEIGVAEDGGLVDERLDVDVRRQGPKVLPSAEPRVSSTSASSSPSPSATGRNTSSVEPHGAERQVDERSIGATDPVGQKRSRLDERDRAERTRAGWARNDGCWRQVGKMSR